MKRARHKSPPRPEKKNREEEPRVETEIKTEYDSLKREEEEILASLTKIQEKIAKSRWQQRADEEAREEEIWTGRVDL